MEKKTAEEILFRRLNKTVLSPIARKIVIEEMHEFADQFKPKWVSVDVIPEISEKPLPCLVLRGGKYHHETCIYFKQFQEEIQEFEDDDFPEYEEHDDTPYLPSGWYIFCDRCEEYVKTDVSLYLVGIEIPEPPNESERG